MSAPPDLIEAIAADLGVDPSFVEKDWYAMRLAALLNNVQYEPLKLVFSGGTSLSKGYNLIQRFSEDLDFKLLLPPGKFSRSTRRDYRHHLIQSIRARGEWFLDDAEIHVGNEGRFFRCLIGYPNRLAQAPAIRPQLQLEVTFSSPMLSPERRPLRSFVALARKEGPEVKDMLCVSPVETAADKLSALTWRVLSRQRGSDRDDPALIRHLHDLAALEPLATAHAGFADLAQDLLIKDSSRGQYSSDISRMTPQERLARVLTILADDDEYAREYEKFVLSMSYAAEGDAPSFQTALHATRRLCQSIE